jgi:hypothetical protein
VSAVRIKSTLTGNVFLVEARLRSDSYEKGFAPLTAGGLEFRGLPGEGVTVCHTHADLQETYLLSPGALAVGQTYNNPTEGFNVRVSQAIEGGMRVIVTMAPDPRCPALREKIASTEEAIDEETDLQLLKQLRKELSELKDQAKKLNCQ